MTSVISHQTRLSPPCFPGYS